MTKVAFQGLPGAYSEEALLNYFSNDVTSMGFDLSEQVLENVLMGEVDFGFLPVENSIVGNVAVNLDLLLREDVYIIGETYHPINHCLLALKGSQLTDIKVAYSHPIALGQCRTFINKNKIEPHSAFDTAGSAKKLSETKEKGASVIASEFCAEVYGLEVLAKDIQCVAENITRFVCFVREDKVPTNLNREKTSLAFSTKHHPGALLNCLQKFADHNINLTKLESRPIPENPFNYTFFVDFLGSIESENVENCIKSMVEDANNICLLGSYPLAKQRISRQNK